MFLWQRIFRGGFLLWIVLSITKLSERGAERFKRSDLIRHDSCHEPVFLLIAPWFQHIVTVATRWQKKNVLPHPVSHHYKNRALDELQLLIFASPSHISPKIVGCANRKCITSVQDGSDQQTVFRIAHVQTFMNWVHAESSLYDINCQQGC